MRHGIGATWSDLRSLVRPSGGLERRICVCDEAASITPFLAELKLESTEVAFDRCTAGPGDIVFLPSRYIGTAALARGPAERFAPGVRLVICGPMPLNTDWMTVERLFPGLITAVLGSSPDEDPRGWEATIRKLISRDTFGLRHYFTSDATIEHIAVARGSARSRVRSTIQPMLDASGIASRIAGVLVDAVEELVMRALVFVGGSHLDNIILPPGREIRVAAAIDADTVGVSVSELFTRMGEGELIRSLATAYSARPVDETEDLGFLAAARASVHMVVNMMPGSATEILCLIPRAAAQRARLFATAPRSISVFAVAA